MFVVIIVVVVVVVEVVVVVVVVVVAEVTLIINTNSNANTNTNNRINNVAEDSALSPEELIVGEQLPSRHVLRFIKGGCSGNRV